MCSVETTPRHFAHVRWSFAVLKPQPLPQAQLQAGPAEQFPENSDIAEQSASQVHDDVPDGSNHTLTLKRA
jgi:hypothetical protein